MEPIPLFTILVALSNLPSVNAISLTPQGLVLTGSKENSTNGTP